jgi:Domain of unknown function (DUF4157)
VTTGMPDGSRELPRPTLGARLDALGRELAERHVTGLPWITLLRPVLNRAMELATSHTDRLQQRRESTCVPEFVPARATSTRAGEWHASPHAARPPAAAPHTAEHGDLRSEAQVSPGGGGNFAAGPAIAAAPPGTRLAADVRAALRDIAGRGADVMVVHDGAESDEIARRHCSEAVSIGRDVHLRRGRLRPDTAEGFGLLAHEATHVTAALNGSAIHRADSRGRAFEEEEALVREAVARRAHARRLSEPSAQPMGELPRIAGGSGASSETHADPTPHAMTAGADRVVSAVPDSGSGFDLDALRRSVIGDVMLQLRSEYERGA